MDNQTPNEVAIMGYSAVGKTSLIIHYLYGVICDEPSLSETFSLSVDVNHSKYLFTCHDTDNNRHDTIERNNLKRSIAFIIILEPERCEAMQNILNEYLDFINDLGHEKKPKIAVFVNKIDWLEKDVFLKLEYETFRMEIDRKGMLLYELSLTEKINSDSFPAFLAYLVECGYGRRRI